MNREELKNKLPAMNAEQEILRDLYARLKDGSFLHDLPEDTRNMLAAFVLVLGATSGNKSARDMLLLVLDGFMDLLADSLSIGEEDNE